MERQTGQTETETDRSMTHQTICFGGVVFLVSTSLSLSCRQKTTSHHSPAPPSKGQAKQVTGWGGRAYLEVGGASPQVSSISEERQVLVAKGDGHVDDVSGLRTQTRRNLG